jgi:hypothetical protein
MKILLSVILLGVSVSAKAGVGMPCAGKTHQANMKLFGQDNVEKAEKPRAPREIPVQGLERRN